MSSIMPMMLEILPEDVVMRSIAVVALTITVPPALASSAAAWLLP